MPIFSDSKCNTAYIFYIHAYTIQNILLYLKNNVESVLLSVSFCFIIAFQNSYMHHLVLVPCRILLVIQVYLINESKSD